MLFCCRVLTKGQNVAQVGGWVGGKGQPELYVEQFKFKAHNNKTKSKNEGCADSCFQHFGKRHILHSLKKQLPSNRFVCKFNIG